MDSNARREHVTELSAYYPLALCGSLSSPDDTEPLSKVKSTADDTKGYGDECH